jgi:glycosyltransferase involved in cell wall biosynthesis
MQFSIITPSFRNSDWLKLCIASVADQQVEHEHIVQDAVSDDGTLDWLPNDTRVKAFIEKDQGMYDAVNRGLRKAKGEILAYINCDEQYLPGALQAVWNFFEENPDAEICFADTVVIDARGEFVCFRKVHIPWEYQTYVCDLCTLTCSTFFRRAVIDRHRLFFNDRYRELGDADWIVDAIKKRVSMKVFRHYTTTFAETGHNIGLLPNSVRERKIFAERAPGWVRQTAPVIKKIHQVRRFFQGGYVQKPFNYSIYTKQNSTERTIFHVRKPTPFWDRTFVNAPPAGASFQAQA